MSNARNMGKLIMADWSKYPMNDEVNWPKNEKIIGVLGLGPVSTMDFCSRLIHRPMKKDWHYPRIIIDVNSKIPSRGRYLDLNETDPAPFIRDGIEKLQKMGADFVAVPCNTAHILYDRFVADLSVPVPHIADITAVSLLEKGYSSPLVLCTKMTRDYRLYESTFSRFGLPVRHFPEQGLITEAIYAVKQSGDTNKVRHSILQAIERVSGIDVVILGCTELGHIIHANEEIRIPVVDSNHALADFCIEYSNREDIDSNIRVKAD